MGTKACLCASGVVQYGCIIHGCLQRLNCKECQGPVIDVTRSVVTIPAPAWRTGSGLLTQASSFVDLVQRCTTRLNILLLSF
jgi:hypothetical protein